MLTANLPLSQASDMLEVDIDPASTINARRELTFATGCQARMRRKGNQSTNEIDRLCKSLRKAYCQNRNIERRGYVCY